MEELIKEIKEIRRKIERNKISVNQTIVSLSDILKRYSKQEEEEEKDSETGYFKNLLNQKILEELNQKNKKAEQKVNSLKILMLLKDMGVKDITETQIEHVLGYM